MEYPSGVRSGAVAGIPGVGYDVAASIASAKARQYDRLRSIRIRHAHADASTGHLIVATGGQLWRLQWTERRAEHHGYVIQRAALIKEKYLPAKESLPRADRQASRATWALHSLSALRSARESLPSRYRG